MTTVVDALVVTLGLDPKGFTKGQKDAATAFTKTKEAATKTGKDIESASQKAADSIDRIARNALKLFAIFTAGRAVKDFVSDITSADSALGRLATRIGQAPSDISALATAVGRAGGSVDAAQGSFQRFSDSIQELKTTGNTGILPFLYKVQAAGGKQINLNKDISQTYEDLADNLKAISDTQGAATANYMGKQLGLDEGTVALLVKGSAAYRAQIAASKQLGIATKADTEAAQNLQTSIRTLTQASEGLGRTIMTAVTPTIVRLLEPLERWILNNRAWLATKIEEKVREFGEYLRKIDWEAIGKGVLSFARGANSAAQAIGGWKVAAEAFFALWAASRIAALFVPLFAQLALVRLTLLRMGPIGWGLLGLGAIAGALAAADPNKAIVDGGKNPGTALNPGDELPGAGPATPRDHDESTRPGLFRRGVNSVKRFFGGGEADAHEGGAGIRRRARRSEHATDEGRLNARAPEGAGKYRPEYKVTDADLSQRTADIIAGEAIRKNPESIDAVINNMMNRVGSKGWGPSGNLQEVATAPGQYEAAWKGSKASPSETAFIRERIKAIASGGVPDNTNGSNAYRASTYRGPWYQKHRDAPVVGGNRYAFEPSAANGPYAPYAKPKDVPTPTTSVSSVGRKPDVLADPKDERRQPVTPPAAPAVSPPAPVSDATSRQMGGTLADRAANGSKYGPQTPYPNSRSLEQMNRDFWADKKGKQPSDWKQDKDTGNWKPVFEAPKPSAWNGIPNAAAFVAQAQSAQAAIASSTSNDNRSTVSNDTRIGDVHIHTAANDPDGIARDMEGAFKKRSFAMGANYGQV